MNKYQVQSKFLNGGWMDDHMPFDTEEEALEYIKTQPKANYQYRVFKETYPDEEGYYIVMNEWKYPTNSGRTYIGDYDTEEEAMYHAQEECEGEYDNFLNITNGEYYEKGSGPIYNAYVECEGYAMHSSKDKDNDYYFRSIIIKREIE